MKPQIAEITLGVSNLETSVQFYRDALGFPAVGIQEKNAAHGGVAYIDLQSGIRLALRPLKNLSEDIGVNLSSEGLTGITFGHYVSSREEVDNILEKAFEAEAPVRYACDNLRGGYSGYFQDPDRHLWEVAFNPLTAG